jgi:hypothetical protein
MLNINLIGWNNGAGLSRDIELIAGALEGAGISVHRQPARGRGKLRKWFGPWAIRAKVRLHTLRGGARYDLNIMLEHIYPQFFGMARRNVLVPNQEMCSAHDIDRLARMDGILVKTASAADIFAPLHPQIVNVGFTSIDQMDETVERKRAFFHLAGRSSAKRTALVLDTWERHPEWPQLTVLQHPRIAKRIVRAENIEHRVDYISDVELRRLQNGHLFHLCPSEAEGFGHYLVEAMSVGAIVLTTDGPPMNELVSPERGILIPYRDSAKRGLATRYLVDAAGLESSVDAVLTLPPERLAQLSAAARGFYLDNDRRFAGRWAQAVAAMARAPRTSG